MTVLRAATKVPFMGSFTIRPLGLVVLLGFLAVITLILILPQVDLLDTAFQRNTSPLAIHARSISAARTGAQIRQFRLRLGTSIPAVSDLSQKSVPATSCEHAEVLNQSFRC